MNMLTCAPKYRVLTLQPMWGALAGTLVLLWTATPLLAQHDTSRRPLIETSAAAPAKAGSSAASYPLQLLPGQVFEGFQYLWLRAQTGSVQVRYAEVHDVGWLALADASFTLTGCQQPQAIRFQFTAPQQEGQYTATVRDAAGQAPDWVVTLTVTRTPTLNTGTLAADVPVGTMEAPLPLTWRGLTGVGCLPRYVPDSTAHFSLSTAPAASWLQHAPANGELPLDDTLEVALTLSFDAPGVYTTYQVLSQEFFSLPAFTLLTITAGGAEATTLTVNTAADASDASPGDGACDTGQTVAGAAACTLRAALEEANATPGDARVIIAFGIVPVSAGGAATGYDPATDTWTISPRAALPPMARDNLTIDALTQQGDTGPAARCDTLVFGAQHTHKVILDGLLLPGEDHGLTVQGSGAVVRGLAIGHFRGHGVLLDGRAALVACNYIGTDAAGTTAAGNLGDGIRLGDRTALSVIANNLISGNAGAGIHMGLFAENSLVVGNLIGTNAAGDRTLANDTGLRLFSARNITIGSAGAQNRNVISGNTGNGLSAETATSKIVLWGNYIGTDLTGERALPNGGHGLNLHGLPEDYIIGAPTPDGGNVISGNQAHGIRIFGGKNVGIQRNFIGTDRDGTDALPNRSDGVFLTFNTEGSSIMANTIAFNGRNGVTLDRPPLMAGARNRILGNSIFSNAGLGIDIDNDGITANDEEDGDDGANNRQNFPELGGGGYDAGTRAVTVTYHVPAKPGHAAYPLTVTFYLADADAEEGQTLLGMVSYTEDDFNNGGTATHTFTAAAALPDNAAIVATATDAAGNTSEFSAPMPLNVPVAVEDERGLPDAFALHQNYPNPFNPRTTLRFDLPGASHVTLTVYDLLGRRIATLIDGIRPAGTHAVTFDARDLPSGVYFYRLEAGRQVQTRALTVLKCGGPLRDRGRRHDRGHIHAGPHLHRLCAVLQLQRLLPGRQRLEPEGL